MSNAVYCQEGWFSSRGQCIKVFRHNSGITHDDAKVKCEEDEAWLMEPLNEMDHNDMAILLNNFTDIVDPKCWIGMSSISGKGNS